MDSKPNAGATGVKMVDGKVNFSNQNVVYQRLLSPL